MSSLIHDRLSDEVALRGQRVELVSDVREPARPWTRDTALPGLFRVRPDVAGTTVECIVEQFKNVVVVVGPDANRGLSGVFGHTNSGTCKERTPQERSWNPDGAIYRYISRPVKS